MAKKRRKQKEEEEEEKYEFVPPEFDEKQFLLDEMKATKRTLFLVGYAILMGIIGGIVSELIQSSILGLAIFFLGIVSIKMFFQKTGFDVTKFTKRIWLESALYYFLMFLAMWTLIINVPFADHVPPEFSDVSIAVDLGAISVSYAYTFDYIDNTYSWVSNNSNYSEVGAALRTAYTNGYTVEVSARIADGTGLASAPYITFKPDMMGTPRAMTSDGDNFYSYTIEPFGSDVLSGSYFTFRFSADDVHGNSASYPAQSLSILVLLN